MAFFQRTKNRPQRPGIDKEHDFIVWLLKYYDAPDMKLLRQFFPKSTREKGIEALAGHAMRKLDEYKDGESLMDFVADTHEGYVELRVALDKRGGFWRVPKELQAAFIQVITLLVTLPYFIKYKYGVDVALPVFFKLPELDDL